MAKTIEELNKVGMQSDIDRGLYAIATGDTSVLPTEPSSRVEEYLEFIAHNGGSGGGDLSAADREKLNKVPVIEQNLTTVKSQLEEKVDKVIPTLTTTNKEVDKAINEINAKPSASDAQVEAIINKKILDGSLSALSLGDNSITTSKYKDNSITPLKTSFCEIGKNIFNKNTITMDKFINNATGALTDYSTPSTYASSDYMMVEANTQYFTNSVLLPYFAFYDSNKSFITPQTTPLPNSFTTPSNAKYMRLSFTVPNIDISYVMKGNSAQTYEPYKETLKKDIIPNSLNDKLEPLQLSQLAFTESLNVFDKNKRVLGKYVNNTNGVLVDSSTYDSSDYMLVKPNTIYTATYRHSVAFYDANKIFISGKHLQTDAIDSFTAPSNAKYARVTIIKTQVDTYMCVKGTTIPYRYQPYQEKISSDVIDLTNAIDEIVAFLPNEICVAVGRTIEIYNKQVAVTGNINNYHFQWDCSIGSAMKRKFSVTGQFDKIGEYDLKLNIYDNNFNCVKKLITKLRIVNNVITNELKVLTIGDSLSNNKSWYDEMLILSSNKLKFVGTRGTIEGKKHEGRSGFSAKQYLEATSYTFESEGVHPFWNSTKGRFDYANYKTANNINPDIIDIFLGTNNISIEPTGNANGIKQIVDYIRQDDPNIPIYITNTLYMGNQDGIGVQKGSDGYASALRGRWKYEEDRKVFNLMERLFSLLKGYNKVYFTPIALTHDSEYNFGSIETPVNPRATQKELLPNEAVHPQLQGYQQFADCKFSTVCGHLS